MAKIQKLDAIKIDIPVGSIVAIIELLQFYVKKYGPKTKMYIADFGMSATLFYYREETDVEYEDRKIINKGDLQ